MPPFQQDFSCLEALRVDYQPTRSTSSPLSWHIPRSWRLSPACLEVGPRSSQRPHHLCSSFLVSSLPSERLWVYSHGSNGPQARVREPSHAALLRAELGQEAGGAWNRDEPGRRGWLAAPGPGGDHGEDACEEKEQPCSQSCRKGGRGPEDLG